MSPLTLILFAILALFIRYLSEILQFLRVRKFSQTIPGPTIREFIKNARKGQLLDWLLSLRQKYGKTFCIWLGKDLMVFFTDPEDIKCILSNNTLLYKSANYSSVEPWLGKGLVTSGGEVWHRRRKLLTPAFHFKILSEFKEPMEENCKILISKLNERANGEQFDIYPYITLFSLDVICETAMGIKKHAQMKSDSEYVQAVKTMCRIQHQQSYSFWQRFPIIFQFTAACKERDAALKILHGETNNVIRMRKKMLTDANVQNLHNAQKSDEFGGKRRLAFLDMLLISQMEGAGLTDIEIREEVDTFMFAGHDTTSSAIAFAIYLLSQHADVQQRAYEEALALEGYEKESMPYLEAVIKETLRLYPSAPFFSRKVYEDIQINGMTVPKGASVSNLVYVLHRDAKSFPDPEKFDPKRFLGTEKELHPFAFAGFSAGPRNCIGQKFAMLELKTTLANLLRNFELLPVVGFKPILLPEIVIKSKNGIQIRMKLRK